MNFVISESQAKEIVHYYDRKHSGEIAYEPFLRDVCADVKPILSFTDLSPRQIAASKASLQANPFIPKPFAAPDNKLLENYKRKVKASLVNKVNKVGGTVASWIREAFVTWDPFYTGKISDWKQLQGASKRLGVTINEEEARELIHCYDRFHTNEMHYNYLTKEIMEEDPHFLVNGKIVDTTVTPTQRTPKAVFQLMNALKKAINIFIKKAKGQLNGRDLLHGTFLRFDGSRSGRINRDAFIRLLNEFKVPAANMDDGSVNDCMKWFDTNGSDLLDYNDFTRQMYGSDVVTEPLTLPPVINRSGQNSLKLSKSFDAAVLSGKIAPTLRNPNISSASTFLATSSLATVSTLHQVPENFIRPTYSSTSVGSLITDPNSVTENPYVSTSKLQSIQIPNQFSVKPSVMERNLDKIESPGSLKQQQKLRKNKIILEKIKIEKKLQAIEEQRKKLIDDHKARHSQNAEN